MPSPFPGMDPWLEGPAFCDLRFSFVVRLSAAINALVPPGYCSRIRHIVEEGQCFKDGESYLDVIRICHPNHVPLLAIEIPERHPEWRNCRAVGTWPSGRITIRLFRDPWHPRHGRPADPEIVTQQFGETDRVEISPLDYTQPLPTLTVEYDPDKPALQVPLQPILDSIYDTGLYPRWVKYTALPVLPLTPDQEAWADGVLKAKGSGKIV